MEENGISEVELGRGFKSPRRDVGGISLIEILIALEDRNLLSLYLSF